MKRPAVLVLTLLVCSSASAWGPEGHVIVGRIAELNLNDAAKTALADLLPDTDFSNSNTISASALVNFADHVRRNPNFPQYKFLDNAHFVDIPVDPVFVGDPVTFCQREKCVITAIDDFKVTLASKM